LKEREDSNSASHGIAINKIDSTLVKEIRFIHFDSSTGVIFPKEYAKTIFRQPKNIYFTPDTSLIKRIDHEIVVQYCTAMTRFDSAVWHRTFENLKDVKDEKVLERAKKQMVNQRNNFITNCPSWQHDLIYYDRQYIGYTNESGERIIYIQLLDFRKDPYKLKDAFSASWIHGWHGWFETNTSRIHFNVDKNRLTINEEL
jgi:hypothetical protein